MITNTLSTYAGLKRLQYSTATTSTTTPTPYPPEEAILMGLQPYDDNLYAIASLTGTTGVLRKTGAGIWVLDNTTFITEITSSQITTALGYTPLTNARTLTINGVTYDLTQNRSWTIAAGITSFNTRTGAITLLSSDVTTALGFTPENAANKGVANGYASLDGAGLIPSTQLPSYVDDVLEYTDLSSFPLTGTTGKIYVDLTTNKVYRWSGSTYIEVSPTVGTIWGGITGTLANQTDLQSALDAKVPTTRTLTINGTTYDLSANRSWTINSMVYPPAGIAVSTGTAWGASIVDNSTNWNTAYSWGNHASAGYLTSATAATTYQPLDGDLTAIAALVGTSGFLKKTAANTWSLDTNTYLTSFTETDPVFVASAAYGITSTNISNWNTAYGWGNHASAGYLTSATASTTYVPVTRTITINGTTYDLSANRSWTVSAGSSTLSALTDVAITSVANAQLLRYNSTSSKWENWTPNYLTSYTETDTFDSVSLRGNITSTSIGVKTASAPVASFEVNGATKTSGSELLTYTIQTGASISTISVGHLVQAPDFTNATTSGASYTGVVSSVGAIGTNTGSISTTGGHFNVRPYNTSTGPIFATGIQAYAIRNNSSDISTNASNSLTGILTNVGHQTSVNTSITTNTVYGISNTLLGARGTITTMAGQFTAGTVATVANNTALVTTFYGLRTGAVVGATSGTGTGTITSYYDLYLEGTIVQATGVVTNKWGVYQTNAAHINYLAGALLIGTTTNSGFTLDVTGTLRATSTVTGGSFVRSGGTSSQFLKADGSIDSNVYLTSYTETDTLASVTGRGATTSTLVAFTGKATLGNRSSASFNGNVTGLTINNTAEIRSLGSENPPALTWHYEGLATRHILMTSAGVINVVSPSNENSGVAVLAVNGNTVLHAGNYTSYAAPVNGNTATDFSVNQLLFAQTAYSPTAAARASTSAMSIKMWDNYFYGTGLGSDYGIVLEYYGRSGHVNSEVYFDAAGGSWYRTAAYNAGYGSWQKYVTENSGTWGISITGTAGSISGFNNPTTAPTANTIVYRDASGDIAAREIVLSSGLSTATPTVLVSMYPTTNQLVRTTPGAVAAALSGQTMNISGTATNITAYTINQNLGTGNSPTFAGLTVNGSVTMTDGNVELYKSQTVDMSNTAVYSTANYYPVTIPIGTELMTIHIQNNLNSNVPSWSTHGSGFTLNLRWVAAGSGWGTTEIKRTILQYHQRFANQTICGGITQMGNSSTEVVWLRGGGTYYFRFSRNVTATAQSGTYTVNSESVSPTASVQNDVWSSVSGTQNTYVSNLYATTNAFIQGNQIIHAGNIGSQSVNYATTAGSANSVAWTNVSGRPTTVSSFTNDSNYVVSGTSPTFTEVYANNWFRNNGSNEGLYNEVTTQHLSSNQNGYWDISSTTAAASGVIGIRLYTGGHVNTLRGYLYSDGSGIGLLNNQGGWSVLCYQGASYGGELRGTWSMGGNTIITSANIGSQSVNYAASAGSVAWTNVSGRPTTVSSFTNDSGYITNTNGAYNVTAGEGNGVYFWQDSTNYTIKMGVTAGTYQYGPVTDYSMRFTMGAGTGRGFTWGYAGASPTMALNANSGNLQIAGTFTEASSIRYKEDIQDLTYSVEDVIKLRGVTYKKKGTSHTEIGVIAEEVNDIIPEVVAKNSDGSVESVSYGRLTAVLIEAIKEQQKQIEELKNLLNAK